jgi:glycosyltransferase involved in cell wall biosynthesis
MNTLLITASYPPEHAGAGKRLHETYLRLTSSQPALAWSVLTRRAEETPTPAGPQRLHWITAPKTTKPLSWPRTAFLERRYVSSLATHGLFKELNLIHCASFTWLSLFATQEAKKRGIPVIRELVSVADGGTAQTLGGHLLAPFIRSLNSGADLLIAISPRLADEAKRAGIQTPIWVRPNPVDLSRFHLPSTAQRQAARTALASTLPGFEEKHPVIFQLGRIRPLKNQLLTVQALQLLPQEYRLVLAGPVGPEDKEYLERIRVESHMPSIKGRVAILADSIPDPERIFMGTDLLAFPSTHEGLGNVMLEALCCGLPVAASRIKGITDWIIMEEENGALTERTPQALAQALQRANVLKPKSETIALSAAKRFGAATIDEQFWALASSLIQGKRGKGLKNSCPGIEIR